MSATAYRLVGFVVWRALKWYLRDLLPSPRRMILSAGLTLAVMGLAAGLLRRASS